MTRPAAADESRRFADAKAWADSVNALFQSQLKAFVSGLDQLPVPMEQDRRAGAVAFLAAFATETISASSRRLLDTVLNSLEEDRAYSSDDWFKLPYLHAAAFHLHGGMGINIAIRNIACGSSNLRQGFFAPIGLVAHKLDLRRTDFLEAMRQGLEMQFFYMDAGICLLLSSAMPRMEKVAILESWRPLCPPGSLTREEVETALSGRAIRNRLIFSEYSEIAMHIAAHALSSPGRSARMTEAGPRLPFGTPEDFAGQVRRHPLFSSWIALNK